MAQKRKNSNDGDHQYKKLAKRRRDQSRKGLTFLDLPGEIRNRVYELYFGEMPAEVELVTAHLYRPRTKILGTNKQVSRESSDYLNLYKEEWRTKCAFSVDLDDLWPIMRSSVPYPPPYEDYFRNLAHKDIAHIGVLKFITRNVVRSELPPFEFEVRRSISFGPRLTDTTRFATPRTRYASAVMRQRVFMKAEEEPDKLLELGSGGKEWRWTRKDVLTLIQFACYLAKSMP